MSAAIVLTRFDLNDRNSLIIFRSKGGAGFHGIVGKEWWVSPKWGLGVAGEFIGASLEDRNVAGVTWTATSFSLLFSATYN